MSETVLFDAVLTPHRSLPRSGFRLLLAAIALANAVTGTFVAALGGWPILAFLALDVPLVALFLCINYRSGRMRERLRLTRRGLEIERTDPGGRTRRVTLAPFWLRVEMDDPPEHGSQLVLASRGRRERVGAFLTPQERLEVARALRTALVPLRA